jgi:hypothetical protein
MQGFAAKLGKTAILAGDAPGADAALLRSRPILVDQGEADGFLAQLRPEALKDACARGGVPCKAHANELCHQTLRVFGPVQSTPISRLPLLLPLPLPLRLAPLGHRAAHRRFGTRGVDLRVIGRRAGCSPGRPFHPKLAT